MEKDSSVEPVQGLEVGVEVGQDNLGMDNVEEETAHINEDPGMDLFRDENILLRRFARVPGLQSLQSNQ